MGQQASQFLDCRLFKRDNSSQIKHQQLLKDLKLMQQQNDQKRILSLKQRQKSLQQSLISKQNPSIPLLTQQKVIVNHDHILKYSQQSFPKSMQYESGGFIQIPQISLSDILQIKLNTTQFFPANDIHGILGGLLSAMSYLQSNNINHHDIYPSSIYYSNNRYKLSNPVTTQSSYQRTFNQKRFSYLSPQLIEALVNGLVIQDHTLLFKPDVFSLGMVMLEVCSLKSSSQCYDPQTYSIVEVNVRNRLNAIEARYSISVSTLIASMLQHDPKKRMSATQILEIFERPHSHSPLVNKVSNIPTKIPPNIPPPVDVPVVNIKNTQRLPSISGGKQVIVNGSSQRMSKQYNIVVTPPPPPITLNNGLNQSLIGAGMSPRPPTFNPHLNQIIRRDSLNGQKLQRVMNQPLPNVNLQELDNRIDRILATSRKYA